MGYIGQAPTDVPLTSADILDGTITSADLAAGVGAGETTGAIGGLKTSNDGTDAAHDINIAVGFARDYADAVEMVLASALIKKIDATWAVGTNAGGLDSTDTVAADTGYGVYLIRRSDTGVVDVLMSSDMTAAGSALTMPTNYDQKRLIGWIHTDGSANIIAFVQSGDYFRLLGEPVSSVTDTTASSTWEDLTMTCPPLSLAHIYVKWNDSTPEVAAEAYIRAKGSNDNSVAAKMGWIAIQHANASGFYHAATIGMIITDASKIIQYAGRDTGTDSAVVTIEMIGCDMLIRSNP